MIRRFLLPSAAVLSLAVLAAGPAFAVPVSCPGTASSNDREITLDTTPAATCVAYGQGNFGSSDANTHLGAGLWTLIDKSDDGNSYYGSNGELFNVDIENREGSFDLNTSVFGAFAEIFLVIKVGGGGEESFIDWALFEIFPLTNGGDIDVVNGNVKHGGGGGISHLSLYGRGQPTSVPEPATLGLLGLGLLGMGVLRRRAA